VSFSARVLGALCLLAFGHNAASAAEPAESLVQAYNRSGLELFEALASKPGNLVISPYSIGTAMAMALVGARGDTEAEMARVLNLELPPAEVADADQRLNASLTERFAKEGVKLSLANALHLTKYGKLVADSYKKLLADKFGAELFSGSDLATINQWVKQKTDGKIDEILTRLDPYSVCVLLNAVYFKARWDSPFDQKHTKPGTFHLSRDESVEVPMMRQSGRYRVLRAQTFDAVELPYAGEQVAMIVLLPMRLGDPGEVAIALSDKTIEAVVRDLGRAESEYVNLSMPSFKTEFGADLIPAFSSLGMKLAFNQDRADFTGITESTKEEDRIHISQIEHKTVIDVTEEGTEAAAATAVEFALRSAPPPTTSVTIDRSFFYLIADRATGTILFMGRLSDPRVQ